MIQTILLTVLFTLLGVSLAACLVWLVVTSWKMKKVSKQNSLDIVYLTSSRDEIIIGYNDQISDIYSKMDSRFDEIINEHDIQISNIYSTMDSRFDKTYKWNKWEHQFEKVNKEPEGSGDHIERKSDCRGCGELEKEK